ncbi:MAG TPA: MBL fold metallo-hydrolase [Chthoniobacterales bacterium]|jgi:L-ascorbate metabolism protein UlaG (beta-lactamase superfamily)
MATMQNIQPRRRSPVRRWYQHLWREWTKESYRPILPAFARPEPSTWSNTALTAAWLGHSTVLINFFGWKIITDPVLFPRCGIRLPGMTVGPKRLTQAALRVHELPAIDLVLLSHAHFDHFDMRTLHRIPGKPLAITAPSTRDLLRWTRLRNATELRWGETTELRGEPGALRVRAFPVRHWGARLRRDHHRGYNGYVLERNGHRVIFSGDTAMTDSFAALRERRPADLAIMSIGAYDPWIHSHATPEQAVAMANAAGADHILPVHHQTFRLSAEPFREPIERFEAALQLDPERIALREIGETFALEP